MIGLAWMAWVLAYRRTWRTERAPKYFGPFSRGDADAAFPISAEYYRIIDRLARGEAP